MGVSGPSDSNAQQSSAQTTVSTTGSQAPASGGDSSPINSGAGVQYNLASGAHYDASPQIVTDALNQMASVVNNALQQVSDLNQTQANGMAQQGQTVASSLSSLQNQLGGIAANTASGGQTDNNKTVLYIVLAVAGLLAAVFYGRGKSA